jgi:Domain of unknown function (DUF4276)
VNIPRLLVHVEGQTEETFVNEVLSGHLMQVGYASVSARIIGNARLRSRRGGIRPWPAVRRDIVNHLKGDLGCIATTMVDFYGLPREGEGAWPGRAKASEVQACDRARIVEDALANDIAINLGIETDSGRFVPFVLMHEFEALLFSDCQAFSRGIGRSDLESRFMQIRNSFESPEDINDSPDTCPSRRVLSIVHGYEKPLLGVLAVLEIGLIRIRKECPHFNNWLQRLESLI